MYLVSLKPQGRGIVRAYRDNLGFLEVSDTACGVNIVLDDLADLGNVLASVHDYAALEQGRLAFHGVLLEYGAYSR